MYRYQTKHKLLSLLLVFSLLVLTGITVFPTPASAAEVVWWESTGPPLPMPFIDLFPGAPFETPEVPPGQLDKLILDVIPPQFVGNLIVNLYSGPSPDPVASFELNWIEIAGYWQLLSSFPPGITLTDINAPIVTFSPPLPFVTKASFLTTAPFPITINSIQFVADIPNQLPVANANGPYTGTVNVPVALDGSGSTDPDDNIVLYEWDFDGDGTYDYSSPTDPTATHAYGSPVVYTAQLRVTDDEGLSDTDAAEVTITAAPTPPPVEVGGEVYPVNKVGVLAPWIALTAAILAGATIAVKRRRVRS